MNEDFSISKLLPQDWQSLVEKYVNNDTVIEIEKRYTNTTKEGRIIYPDVSRIFHAFQCFPVETTKVVILGQDPYHGHGQAMGLSFSVPLGVKIPPSLRNIFRELMTDQETNYPASGDLTKWADQGVLLLNSILTVEQKKPGSHAHFGWETFTDGIIQGISNQCENVVFMLWGNYAKKKKELIDDQRHLILEAAHPSPLARDKYQGSKHFSQANSYLTKHSKNPIQWKLD